MPRAEVRGVVDAVVVGCGACGWSIEVRPSELRLLVDLVDLAHLGPMVSATHMAFDGGRAFWAGDADLLVSRGLAGNAVA